MATLTAAEILRREYGSSRNMLTPYVVRRGKLARDVAFELAWGSGLEPGSTLYGVSVVRALPDGTTARLYGASSAYHSLEAAEAAIENLRDPDALEAAIRGDA